MIDSLAYIDAPTPASLASLANIPPPATLASLNPPPQAPSLLSQRIQSAPVPLPPLDLSHVQILSPPDDNEDLGDWISAYKNSLIQLQAQVNLYLVKKGIESAWVERA
jgi:hypothetical protein